SSIVHAFLRLTVRVAAYRPYRFPATARDLLHRDLQQLRQRGVRVGRARRWHLPDPDDPWPIPDDAGPDADLDDTFDDLDPLDDDEDPGASEEPAPVTYIHVRLYDEDELFDVDPFDPFHLDAIETA